MINSILFIDFIALCLRLCYNNSITQQQKEKSLPQKPIGLQKTTACKARAKSYAFVLVTLAMT
ncbi:MAG: hypothetical protein CMR00_07410 [[Chlorobium] sp. 445]|nr:MAG: hypothetical protein CMR00_07410 [[Chlorobium] sp. 445]